MDSVVSEFCFFILVVSDSAQSVICGFFAESILVLASALHGSHRGCVIRLFLSNFEIWIILVLLLIFAFDGLALTSSGLRNTLLILNAFIDWILNCMDAIGLRDFSLGMCVNRDAVMFLDVVISSGYRGVLRHLIILFIIPPFPTTMVSNFSRLPKSVFIWYSRNTSIVNIALWTQNTFLEYFAVPKFSIHSCGLLLLLLLEPRLHPCSSTDRIVGSPLLDGSRHRLVNGVFLVPHVNNRRIQIVLLKDFLSEFLGHLLPLFFLLLSSETLVLFPFDSVSLEDPHLFAVLSF